MNHDIPWAELLRRVFATDVLSCPCGGHRSVVAVVVDDAMARAVLATLGLPCTPSHPRANTGPAAGRVLVRRRFVACTTADAFGRDQSAPTSTQRAT
jgi:hypothetical protein